ncbi:RNA polymerase sigma factor [Microbacterium sp.]|uniref:RNA polymerase sigma factor n=1 Tax=Microbacterium sp. TaxID=51671 RepID=UPI003C73633E
MANDGEPSSTHGILLGIVEGHRARLIGALARWCGDVQLAEDGFSEAVEAALTAWPSNPPTKPEAWLATVARNRIRDTLRSAAHRRSTTLPDHMGAALEADLTPSRDDTLALLFACAHPALDRSVHAPLILQVALGVGTADVATAFALPVATLSKRLVRAKQKLRVNRASFEIPEQIEGDRIGAVLDAIYAAYSVDWLRIAPADATELVIEEAIHASQLLLRECPENHEVRGLASLLLFLHSRSSARVANEILIPLDEQERTEWDHHLIRRANRILRDGLHYPRSGNPGPYELQAAIQSAHATSTSSETPWPIIAQLYDALIAETPSMGAQVARAVAIARSTNSAAGLAILDALPQRYPAVDAFQAFHAARGALLHDAGEIGAAAVALRRAHDLSTDLPSRNYLSAMLSTLRRTSTEGDPPP